MPVVIIRVPTKVLSLSISAAGTPAIGMSSASRRPSFFSCVMATASAIIITSAGDLPAANSADSLAMISVVPDRNTSTVISGWSLLNAAITSAIWACGCEVYSEMVCCAAAAPDSIRTPRVDRAARRKVVIRTLIG